MNTRFCTKILKIMITALCPLISILKSFFYKDITAPLLNIFNKGALALLSLYYIIQRSTKGA